MKKRLVMSATMFVLCAALCLLAGNRNVQAQEQADSETNLETQLYLIVGTNQDVDEPRLPSTLDPIIKQLRATLPFKNYRLAATLINRVKNEGRLELSWIGGPMAAAASAPATLTPTFSQFKVRQVKIVRDSEGRQVVQMLGFNFGTRVPIQSGAVAASGSGPGGGFPVINYENTGVATDISMRESEPVIVGTLNVGPSGDAIILVVSAKRTQK